MRTISQCIFRAVHNTLKTKDTFRTVFPFAGIVCYIHVHWTYLFTFAAGNTFIFITFYPEQGKITHGFQKHRDWAYVFAECAIIFKDKCQDNANNIV